MEQEDLNIYSGPPCCLSGRTTLNQVNSIYSRFYRDSYNGINVTLCCTKIRGSVAVISEKTVDKISGHTHIIFSKPYHSSVQPTGLICIILYICKKLSAIRADSTAIFSKFKYCQP